MDMTYYDMTAAILDSNPRMTPCELAEENDRLKQKISSLCKERDQLHDQINRLVKRIDDETAAVNRLEKENRAKEQYIAEVMGAKRL